MPNLRLSLTLLSLLAIFWLPIGAGAQVNRTQFVNPATGTLNEEALYYASRYQQDVRDWQRREAQRYEERLLHYRERELAYAADPCGLGCEGHEGLRVATVSGTRLAAVLHKVEIDGDAMVVRLRFFNDGNDREPLVVDPSKTPESFYLEVEADKFGILGDEEGELEAKEPLDTVLEPGEIESWWARFPAPSPGTDAFNLHLPGVVFLEIPLERS
jgi:hypothetical protein